MMVDRIACSSAFAAIFFLATGTAGAAPSSAPMTEDCVILDPIAVNATNTGGDWKLMQGALLLADFGADSTSAQHAVDVIRHYHFTRQCFVGRPNASMMYWRNGVAIPPGNMPGQDCITLKPEAVGDVYADGHWDVIEGKTWLLDFGANQAAADKAVAVIRRYQLDRECFVARPHVMMQYWLSE